MKYYFTLTMTPEEFLPYYRGQYSSIVTTASNGQRVQFPAMHMRKFMTAGGVKGTFCLETANNKFISLTKLR
ncbi:DUF2835 domain-containing protein [Thalassotalea euphylliae]|uniref:DUF2835 domain-containing protein n=1 Tax=Thalassotalea euphylliae TaxID=1655234 RepID=UPI00363709C2